MAPPSARCCVDGGDGVTRVGGNPRQAAGREIVGLRRACRARLTQPTVLCFGCSGLRALRYASHFPVKSITTTSGPTRASTGSHQTSLHGGPARAITRTVSPYERVPVGGKVTTHDPDPENGKSFRLATA